MEIVTMKNEVNKELLRKRFRCACKTYDKHAIVQKKMALVLTELAQKCIEPNQQQMMELGCGTGLLTKEVMARFTCKNYFANDLVAEVEEYIKSYVKPEANFTFLNGDAEKIIFPGNQDVIWSGATIQWIEDQDVFFSKMAVALNEKGYLVISSFDIDNYKEVKAITGKGIDYKSMDEVFRSANKNFNILDSKNWRQTMYFATPTEVLKHMRYTGVNSISNTHWGKCDLERFSDGYEEYKRYWGYPLTYHPFVVVLQKK